MDSLGRVVGPKLVSYINTAHVEIILVYKLQNVHFFDWEVAKGLALDGCVGRGLHRSPVAL